MGFTINQVRHLYVANKLATADLTATSEVGEILPKVSNGTLMFQYKSPAGIIGSDKIEIKNIEYTKATAAEKLAYPLKLKKVVLDDAVSNAPIAGQEYILKLLFRQYIGMGDEDTTSKYGYAKAGANTTASDLYKAIALSLAKNVAKDTTPLVKIYLDDTVVTDKTKDAELTGTYTCIKLEEVEQAWDLGTMPEAFIHFEVEADTIIVEGEEYIWGKVTDETPVTIIGNGKKTAELEYFCMGARGDYYRNLGWPYVIKTTYLIDPTKTYDMLDIHYSYVGSNESVQKSERDITIVAEAGTIMNDIIAAINTAAGTNIALVGATASSGGSSSSEEEENPFG